MKVFWSWQSDTHGPTGRHFVRTALEAAIAKLKQPADVEEPTGRDRREALHLDQDRQGVSGTPELARTIFSKIDQSAVFVADVSTMGETVRADGKTKKLINSNVAIEYGYAVKALGDEKILLVQNTHYGDREGLPFDLKHKAGPIQYRLAPDAAKAQRDAEKATLVGILTVALQECLATNSKGGPTAPKFEEIKSTFNRAAFWDKGEVIARLGEPNPLRPQHGSEEDDVYEYRFDQPRALYVRLIPTEPLPTPLTFGKLMGVIEQRRVRVLTRTINAGISWKNRLGAVSYESSGTNRTPVAFTQLHRNGEIWGVTREVFQRHAGADIIAMANVENRVREGIENFIDVARQELGINPPYEIEVGAVGLQNMRLSLPQSRTFYQEQFSDPVHDEEVHLRVVVHNVTDECVNKIATDFLRNLYDLVAVDFPG
jgi:hypothetical protein